MRNIVSKILTFIVFISMTGISGLSLAEQKGESYSLLDELLKYPAPSVRQYAWSDAANEELTKELARDFLRCGFNGIQNKCSPGGGDRFPFGYLPSLGGTARVRYYYMDKSGQKKYRWTAFGDLCAPENVDSLVERIEETVNTHGSTLLKPGGRYLMITGDEIDVQYARTAFREVSPYREKAWREYIRDRYRDTSPAVDTNKDGRTYGAESIHSVDTWEQVPIPQFEDRFKEPYIWDAYRDFHSLAFYGFFRKAEKKANARGIPLTFGMSGHGSIAYPGAAGAGGASYWHQATMDRIFTQEAAFSDWPQQALAHAALDRLSREYNKPVFAWSWFWPGWRGRTGCIPIAEDQVERTFAHIFGHEVHMLLYWVYVPMFLRNFPHMQTIAFWHHWFQKHWDFLKASHPPKAEVALLYPTRTSYFYGYYQYPKHDYGWTPQAFLDLQIPFTVLTEEEIEHHGVGDYKVLVVVTAERISKKTAQAIERFLDRGGMVFTDCDSMAMNIGGKPLNLLPKRFGVRLGKKYKTWFYSSVISREEELWAAAKNQGKEAKFPAKTPYGIDQVPFDTATPQVIEMKIPWAAKQITTYNEVATAQPIGGASVLATFHGEPVIVETEQTLWVGSRPGADICATYPRHRLVAGSEPIPTYWSEDVRSAYQRAAYVDLFGRLCDKAGVRRPARVLRNGKLARNINVYTRINEKTGAMMLILIDQDIEISGARDEYILECPSVKRGFKVWDLTENKPLRWKSPGVVEVKVPEHRAKYIVVGPRAQIAKMAKNQRELFALDLRPKPFSCGERGGKKEPPLPTSSFSGVSSEGTLPEGTLVRLIVKVTNPTNEPKLFEPVVLRGSDVLGLLPGGLVGGVRMKGRHQAQWDDMDNNGSFSSEDEITWQADLAPRQTTAFTIDFLSKKAPKASSGREEDFGVEVRGYSAGVMLAKRKLFGLNKSGELEFGGSETSNGYKIDMWDHVGFVFGTGRAPSLKIKDTQLLADGPVRKVIRLTFASEETGITSTTTFCIYRKQHEEENRIYANAVHRVDKEFNFPKERLSDAYTYSHVPWPGSLLTLSSCRAHPRISHWKGTQCYYEDSLGRLSTTPAAYLEHNFGGWIAVHHVSDALLQVSLKRVRGILSGTNIVDECDGIQVAGRRLIRAAVDQTPETPVRMVDTKIEAGTVWKLESLISLRKGFDENRCRKERSSFANPPKVVIEKVVLHR